MPILTATKPPKPTTSDRIEDAMIILCLLAMIGGAVGLFYGLSIQLEAP